MSTEVPRKPTTGQGLREVVETLLFALLIFVLIRTFLFENYRVDGSSMLPTLHDNQFVVVNKLGYRVYPPQRGDIVVFSDPSEGGIKLIKRLIGLPGETVEIRDGMVLINGVALDEPYLDVPWHSNRPAEGVPDGEFFVLGDNRNNSRDSRSWGYLPRDRMVGKAWLTYWPPDMWGFVRHIAYGDTP